MNSVFLTGYLGDAPRFGTSRGQSYAQLSMAVSYSSLRNGARVQVTDWFRVAAFGKLADSLRCLTKGARIAVRGRLRTGYWEKDGARHWTIDVMAAEIEFLSPKPAINGTPVAAAEEIENGREYEADEAPAEEYFDGEHLEPVEDEARVA